MTFSVRRVAVFSAAIIGAWLLLSSAVFAQGDGEIIRDFDVAASVRADSSVEVTETIVYDFGAVERHGIFRDIPIRYETKFGIQSLAISGVSVTDAGGAPYPFEVSLEGRNERVKVGDPNAYVSGVRTYVIRYVADRAVGYFTDHDELYWNATGNGWQVPIERAGARLLLPSTAGTEKLTASCYVGSIGSTESCSATITSTVTPTETGVRAEFAASRRLEAGEGLTVAVGFPKGVVIEPTAWENALQFLRDNGILALPLLVFAVMLGHWYRKGRDPRGRGTIVPQYGAPDGLAPLEMSAVLNQSARTKDISAEIIYLATKGKLTVTRVVGTGLFSHGDDYIFKKTGSDPSDQETVRAGENLPPFDTELMQSLFSSHDEVKLSDLKEKFYSHIVAITKLVGESVVAKGYYPTAPAQVMAKYFIAAFAFVALVFVFNFVGLLNAAIVAALIISSAIVVVFGYLMPKATVKGAETREMILGLKEYLQIAEKDRINFHNSPRGEAVRGAPEKDPKRFEELLPYAMVLGVERAWAKEFEGVYTAPPSWYADPSGGAFSAIIFANSLHGFSATAASTLASAPHGGSGAGGGGFSGGGGGGGGGGSW
ncbi:MAG: DUF2207 domain-containing protein [bacterium]|nr:DUF2207 domain-containing protein [bacterium]